MTAAGVIRADPQVRQSNIEADDKLHEMFLEHAKRHYWRPVLASGAGAAVLSASRGGGLRAVVSVSAPAHPGDMMRMQIYRIPKPVVGLLLGANHRLWIR